MHMDNFAGDKFSLLTFDSVKKLLVCVSVTEIIIIDKDRRALTDKIQTLCRIKDGRNNGL
jgi:hypothetical protein